MPQLTMSASVMCANLLRLEEDLQALEQAGCDELHFDIMDGLFVPNFTLGFDLIKAAGRACKIPGSAHLMITHPDKYIDRFVEAGCQSVTVHLETCPHIHRTLAHIRDAGASPGVALNPGTSLTKLEYVLDLVDRVLLMTVEPGYAGQPIISNSFDRVAILHQNILERRLDVKIEVDGNISLENAKLLGLRGARIFVLGTSSIFNGGQVGNQLEGFRKLLEEELTTAHRGNGKKAVPGK